MTNNTPQLDEQSRAKLDSIVQQMIASKESDANIQAVVNDFKTKYAKPVSQPLSLGQDIKSTISSYTPAFKGAIQGTSPDSQGEGVLLRGIQGGEQAFRAVRDVVGKLFYHLAGGQKMEDKLKAQKLLNQQKSGVSPSSETKKSSKFGTNLKTGLEMANEELGTRLNDWAIKNPEHAKSLVSSLKGIAGIGDIAGTIIGLDVAGMGLNEIPVLGAKTSEIPALLKQGATIARNAPEQITGKITDAIDSAKSGNLDKSASIMNRVARLTPTQANDFKNLAGMTHGEYLAKTGNFGTPQQIIEKESQKFVNSLHEVDSAMASLPGVYKVDSVTTALDDLIAREKNVSTIGAESSDFNRIKQLAQNNAKEGLTMDEVNQVKRLYERNIKLQYAKDFTGQTSEKLARATNVDSAMRNWQFGKARELGLENLPELNKQTQISKNIINSLGKQITGKTGNDVISLTDWIMLSHGNPTSVAGFLTKKAFGSKEFQSLIARKLAPSASIIEKKAIMNATAENINRRVSPTGAKLLSAPKSGIRKSIIDSEVTRVAPKGFKGDIISKSGITP